MRASSNLRRSSSPANRPTGRGRSLPTKVGYLSATDIFGDLTSSELEEVDRMTAMTTCRRGKVFCTPGETGEVLFILKQGRVNLYRVNQDGEKLITSSIGPGSVFGEMSLIGQGIHDTFAEAAEDCTLCVMSQSDLEHVFLSKPQVAVRFMGLISSRLHEVEARMENVAFKSVPARLAAYLLQLAAAGDGMIRGVSHQDLADMVGTYRETLTRILNEFRTEGYSDLGRLRLTILRPEALQDVAQG